MSVFTGALGRSLLLLAQRQGIPAAPGHYRQPVGGFAQPPSRVEAMYAPEMFGETLNALVKVEAGK